MSKQIFKEIKNKKICYLFAFPYMSLFFIFTVLPCLISMFLSLTSFNMLEIPDFIGIDNYVRLFFDDSVFLIAVKNTILMAIVIGPGGYILSLLMAWLINEFPPKVRAFLTLIFYAPSISGNAYLIWTYLFSGDEYGLINGVLMKLGVITSPIMWFNNPQYMMTLVIIVSLWMSLGTSFLAFIAGFQGVDKAYYEAAAIDGIKNRWQELWYVTLPMMKQQMMFSAVMSITSSFSVGSIAAALCGNPSTDYAVHTIMNHLDDYGGQRFEMGYASAIATVLFVLMIVSNQLVKRMISKVGE